MPRKGEFMLATKPFHARTCPSLLPDNPPDSTQFVDTEASPALIGPVDSYDPSDAPYYEPYFREQSLFGTPPYFPLSVPPAKPASEIADELIAFTMQNKIDKRWLSDVLDKGLSLGPVPQLRCVYTGPAMEVLLNNPQDYGDLSDLLDELDRRESELTDCLGLADKIFYGTQLRSFGNDLQSQPEFFDGFTLRFADLMGIAPGSCAVNLFCYFFRPDRLDTASKQVLDLFHDRLKKIVANLR
jgi:hypothetical protein